MKATEEFYIYELLSEWFTYIEHRLAKNTVIGYKLRLRQLWKAVPAKYKNLTSQQIERFLQNLPLNVNSVNTYLSAIKSFCHWCEERHDLPNPTRKVKYFKPEPFKQRTVTEEEFDRLLAVATTMEKNVLLFLSNSGLRKTELCNLKLNDVSGDRRFITVVGKGTRKRMIPLNKTTQKIVENPDFFRFIKIHLQSNNSLYRMLAKLSKRAGISKANPHSFRHFFATRMIGKIDIYRLSKLLGHKNTTITETIYLHFIAERDLDGATDILDKGGEL